jgi:hypothetical protein
MKSPFKVPLKQNEKEHPIEIYIVYAEILCHKITYMRETAVKNV